MTQTGPHIPIPNALNLSATAIILVRKRHTRNPTRLRDSPVPCSGGTPSGKGVGSVSALLDDGSLAAGPLLRPPSEIQPLKIDTRRSKSATAITDG
jgi:hypothetical protein